VKHYTKAELKERFLNIAHDCCEWNQKRNIVVDELTVLLALHLYFDVEPDFIVDWLEDDEKNLKAFKPIFLVKETGVLLEAIQERCENKMEVQSEEQSIIKAIS